MLGFMTLDTETYTPTLDPTLYHRSAWGEVVAVASVGFVWISSVLIYASQKGECSKACIFSCVWSGFETESPFMPVMAAYFFGGWFLLGWASRSRWQHRARTMKIPNPLEEEETVTALIELEPKPLQVEMASGWRLNLETSSSPSFRDALLF